MAAHAKNPPTRMRQDALKHVPFYKFFRMDVLHCFSSRSRAKIMETNLIEQESARGPNGYNTSPGHRQDYVWIRLNQ